jgi:hypothetical protein
MKYCTRCGAGSSDDAAFCSQCGSRMAAGQTGSRPDLGPAPEIPPVPDIPRPDFFGEKKEPPRAQTPPGPSYFPPVQTVYAPPQGSQAPPAVDKGNSIVWLVLNIVLAVLCCCTLLGSLCAIIGIVFAGLSISRANDGDEYNARRYEKLSMILFFVALGVGIAMFIASIAANALNPVNFDYSSWFDY